MSGLNRWMFSTQVLERMAPMVSITIQDAVPTIKASMLQTLNDDDFSRNVRQTIGPMIKSTFVDTLHDSRFTDEIRVLAGPMINNTMKDLVPTIKSTLVETLQDDDFTSDLGRLAGPMLAATVTDPAVKATVTSVIKDWTLDTVSDDDFTAKIGDKVRASVLDANSTLRKVVYESATAALNPFAGRGKRGSGSPRDAASPAARAASEVRKRVVSAFGRDDDLVDFSIDPIDGVPDPPSSDLGLESPDHGTTTPAARKLRVPAPKSF